MVGSPPTVLGLEDASGGWLLESGVATDYWQFA
jgi:hypothetical protein